MANARKATELLVATQNKAGELAKISAAVSAGGANITAVCGYGMDEKANVMLVTDNNSKAIAALKEKGYDVKENDVVEAKLENKVGALEAVGKKIADAGINLNYVYGTVGKAGAPATMILSSDNDSKLVDLLK
ncbi:hypothetical protein ACFL3J_01515 [Candidatus Omnitrophota bacterium]